MVGGVTGLDIRQPSIDEQPWLGFLGLFLHDVDGCEFVDRPTVLHRSFEADDDMERFASTVSRCKFVY